MTQIKNSIANRLDILKAIQTPLGFYVLLALIVESFTSVLLYLKTSFDTLLYLGSTTFLAILAIFVFLLSYFKPETLSNLSKKEIIKNYSNDKEINQYMKKLINTGSTLDIVSNRLHWVSEDDEVKKTLIARARISDIRP